MKIGNTLSESYNTTAGVPQGGFLSATCFIIAINNTPIPLSHGVRGSLCADDHAIHHSSKRLRASTRAIQNSIKRLEERTLTTGLKFSPTKSEVVHFWRDINGGGIREYPVIKLKGENIPRRESTRFLEMILDRASTGESTSPY